MVNASAGLMLAESMFTLTLPMLVKLREREAISELQTVPKLMLAGVIYSMVPLAATVVPAGVAPTSLHADNRNKEQKEQIGSKNRMNALRQGERFVISYLEQFGPYLDERREWIVREGTEDRKITEVSAPVDTLFAWR